MTRVGMLWPLQAGYEPLSLLVVAGVALFVVGFVGYALAAVWRSRRDAPITGREGLIGLIGQARTALGPEQEGMVFVNGELWKAYAPAPLPKDSYVRVLGLRGLFLEVAPADPRQLPFGESLQELP